MHLAPLISKNVCHKLGCFAEVLGIQVTEHQQVLGCVFGVESLQNITGWYMHTSCQHRRLWNVLELALEILSWLQVDRLTRPLRHWIKDTPVWSLAFQCYKGPTYSSPRRRWKVAEGFPPKMGAIKSGGRVPLRQAVSLYTCPSLIQSSRPFGFRFLKIFPLGQYWDSFSLRK